MEKKIIKIDPKVFWPALIVVLGLSLPLAINPEVGGQMVSAALNFVTGQFGWLFLIFGMFCFVTLMWMAFGKYGNIKLGGPDDEPEFSYFSWVAMLFCAGIGIGIMLWSIIEPIYYLQAPPLGIEAGSPMAFEWAHMYGQFHWGFSAWAIYAIPTIPIAYSVYVRKQPSLRFSTASKGILGQWADRWPGKVIDIIVAFGIVGAVATSLGLAVPLVSALFSELFGIPDSFGLNMLILGIWTAIFGTSVWRGLSKGIKILSDINLYLAIALAVFVLFAGPTVFILKMTVNSWSLMLDSFFRISFWMDPINKSGFPEGWTIFYWAWWIAYAPMMGLFVARISKGRTIRDVVIAECLWGTIGCWIFFAIFGGYSLYLTSAGILNVPQILADSGSNLAIIAVIKGMPGASIVLIIYTVLCFVFLSTTIDSSAYTLASVCSQDISGDEQPARWHRVFWALVLAVVAVGLLAVGGLSAVQTSTIVVALPLIPVMFILILAVLKDLKEDYGELLREKILTVDYQPKVSLNNPVNKDTKLNV